MAQRSDGERAPLPCRHSSPASHQQPFMSQAHGYSWRGRGTVSSNVQGKQSWRARRAVPPGGALSRAHERGTWARAAGAPQAWAARLRACSCGQGAGAAGQAPMQPPLRPPSPYSPSTLPTLSKRPSPSPIVVVLQDRAERLPLVPLALGGRHRQRLCVGRRRGGEQRTQTHAAAPAAAAHAAGNLQSDAREGPAPTSSASSLAATSYWPRCSLTEPPGRCARRVSLTATGGQMVQGRAGGHGRGWLVAVAGLGCRQRTPCARQCWCCTRRRARAVGAPGGHPPAPSHPPSLAVGARGSPAP